MDDAVRIAERPQQGRPAGAEPRLERTRLVIDSRVNHAAVVPALMEGNPRFLFEHNDPNAGPAGDNLPCGRQADQAGANDDQGDVVRAVQNPAPRPRRSSERMETSCSTARTRVPRDR